MAFNPATAKPEGSTFDPSTATAEDYGGQTSAFKFDATSAAPESNPDIPELKAARKPTIGQRLRRAVSPLIGETPDQKSEREGALAGLGALAPAVAGSVGSRTQEIQQRGVLPVLAQDASTPLLPEGFTKTVSPFVQRMLLASQMDPERPQHLSAEQMQQIVHPNPNSTTAGIAQAGTEFVRQNINPLNIGMAGGAGLLTKLAQGYGPAASTARAMLRAMGIGFGAQMAHTAGEQAGEAVDVGNDPTKTPAQRAAAYTAPVLTGLGSLAASASAFSPLKPVGPSPEEVWSAKIAKARNVTPEAPLALPEPRKMLTPAPVPSEVPSTEATTSKLAVEPKAEAPAAPPTVFSEGQEVTYTAPGSEQPLRGVVMATTNVGRVKVMGQDGKTVRVPVANVSEFTPEATSAPVAPEGFDPSTAEIEVSLSEPDVAPEATKSPAPDVSERVAYLDEQLAAKEITAEEHGKLVAEAKGVPAASAAESNEIAATLENPPDYDPKEWVLKPGENGGEGQWVKKSESAIAPTAPIAPTPEAPAAKTSKRSISVGLPAHGEPDILNAIEERGGVQTKSGAKNPGGEHDDLSSTFVGSAKSLLRKTGMAPDQLAQILFDEGLHGLKDGTVNSLNDAVSAAIKARDVAKKAVSKNEGEGNFDNALLGNNRARKYLNPEKPTNSDKLAVGDQFRVDDEKVKVTDVDENGVVTIKDGISRQIPPGTDIYPDRGKIRKGTSTKQIIENFLPVEMETPDGKTVPVESQLAGGGEKFSLETATPEQQATEAAAARQRAQEQAQRDKIAALAEKPLTGDSSDVGQGVLLSGDEDLFSGQSAESAAKGKESPPLGGERGAIDERILRALAVTGAAGGGAAYGYSQGDTPEDRLRKAIGYGAAAGVAAYIASKLPAAFADSAAGGMSVAMRAAKNSIENALLGGKDLPNMRAASEKATDAAFRLANARVFGVQQGLNLAAQVLGDKYTDPVFAEKLGSVLVQEMQEAKIIQLHDELLKAKTPGERARIQGQIDNVKPVWDMPATQINSAAEFQAALADPEIIAAIDRHKKLVQAQAEAAHVALGGKLAAVGPNTGAFINTEAIVAGEDLPGAAKRGDLQNVLKRKTAFGKGRTGTADQYEIDYNRQVARMAAGNAERLAKKEYYETLEAEGLAERLPLGERPADPTKFRRERTQELSVTGQLEDTWIRRDVFGEHRQLMNTDSPLDNHLASVVARLMNTVQLKSITDPTFHIANIVSAVTGAPGGGNRLADLGRQLPGVNVADALVRIGGRLADVSKMNPAARADLAEIARVGALREGHPGIVHAVDQAGRLVMNDLFQNLVDEGLAVDSEANRRDFVNQIGQYNGRVMGKIKSLFKEIGISPFIVAGQNFNRLGFRRLLQQPGVKATSYGNAAKLMATSLVGTIVSLVAVPAAVNYLLNKDDDRVKNKALGPNGIPVGAIGWRDPDEQGKPGKLHYVDPLKWTNFRRGARMTGLNAMVTGTTQGRDLNHNLGQAFEDISNAATHPWAGPAINALSIMRTGKSVAGFQEAELANPLDRTQAPTAAQSKLNMKAGLSHLQPQVAAFLAGGRTKNPSEFEVKDGLKKVGTSLAGAGGYYERNPVDAEHGPAQSALYDQQLTRQDRREGVNKIADAWPKMTQAQREQATAKMTDLEGQDLIEALRQNSLGFTPSDRMIHSMGVEDGSRAKYLATQLVKLSPVEQLHYLDDKERKGLITENVGDQLVEELRAIGFKPNVSPVTK